MRRPQVPRALRLILITFWAITASTVVLAGSPSIAAPKVPVLGSLSTRVLDRAGAPVDALVIIKGSHSGIGRTDARGTYKVTVPPGRYEVSAFYAGRTTRPRKVTVAPNRSQQITIRLSVAAGSPARAGQDNGPKAPSTRSTQPGAAQPSTAGAGTSPNPASSSGSVSSAQSQAGSAGAAQSGGGAASPATGGAVASSPPASPGPLTLQGLTADPTITAPGGTSRVAVQVTNPAGDRLTFTWEASAGAVRSSGSTAVWTAPPTAGNVTVSVVVSGIITGQKVSGSVNISVQDSGSTVPTPPPATPPTNGAPQFTATSADPTVVAPGGISTLLVNATDPDGDPLRYSWQASGGTVAPQGNQAIWTAPGSEGQYSITVRADDGQGHTASASIPVSVAAVPSVIRDPALWPFDKLSPWNHPIGSGAVYEPIRAGIWGGGFHTGSLNTEYATIPIWIARDTDPIRKIYVRNRNMAYFSRRIPTSATPSKGSDAHMIIVSPDHSTAFEMYQAVKRADGDWEAAGAGVDVNLKGMGINIFGQAGGFVMADGSSANGGVIRAGELRNGIRHTLQFITDPKMWNRNAPGGWPFVWPASSADGYALQPEPGGYGSSGNLYLGSLVAIPPSVDIRGLGLETPEALEIARALQNYGAYGVDSAGVGTKIVFRYDYAARLGGDMNNLLANWAPFQRDLDRISRQLQLVANSHNAGKQPAVPGGGGTPRVPLAADFASSQSHPISPIIAQHDRRHSMDIAGRPAGHWRTVAKHDLPQTTRHPRLMLALRRETTLTE